MNKIFLAIALLLMMCCNLNAQTLTGTASFYANKFNGRKTATGAIFSNNGLTCACNRLPLGTKVRVTNLSNGKSIVLTVNDRLAANNKRLVDLTSRAAKELGFYNNGLAKVKVEVISKKKEVEALTDEINNAIEPQSSQEGSRQLSVYNVQQSLIDSTKK